LFVIWVYAAGLCKRNLVLEAAKKRGTTAIYAAKMDFMPPF
jgi:hypothetical protein